jgi:hypothetical protein
VESGQAGVQVNHGPARGFRCPAVICDTTLVSEGGTPTGPGWRLSRWPSHSPANGGTGSVRLTDY